MKTFISIATLILSSLLPQLSHAVLIEAGAVYENGSTFKFSATVDDSYVWRIDNNNATDTGLWLLNINYTLNFDGTDYSTGLTEDTFNLFMPSCTDPFAGCITAWDGTIDLGSIGFFTAQNSILNTIIGPNFVDYLAVESYINVSAVPVPAAVWLFGSGLLALLGLTKRNS